MALLLAIALLLSPNAFFLRDREDSAPFWQHLRSYSHLLLQPTVPALQLAQVADLVVSSAKVEAPLELQQQLKQMASNLNEFV